MLLEINVLVKERVLVNFTDTCIRCLGTGGFKGTEHTWQDGGLLGKKMVGKSLCSGDLSYCG